MRTEGRASMARCGWAASRPLVGQLFSGGGLDPARQLCFARRTADTPARAPPRDLRALVHPAFSKLVSILTGLVRRVSEAANRAATPQPNQERTMRFILMGMATKESEAGVPPKPEAFVAMQEYN